MYAGARPCRAMYVINTILKLIICFTWSQWWEARIRVIWDWREDLYPCSCLGWASERQRQRILYVIILLQAHTTQWQAYTALIITIQEQPVVSLMVSYVGHPEASLLNWDCVITSENILVVHFTDNMWAYCYFHLHKEPGFFVRHWEHRSSSANSISNAPEMGKYHVM